MTAPRIDHRAWTLPALLLALATALALSWPTSAIAQPETMPPDREPPSAQALVDRALDRIETVTDRCEDRVAAIEERTIDRLETIADNAEATARTARRSIGAINKTAASCVRAVRTPPWAPPGPSTDSRPTPHSFSKSRPPPRTPSRPSATPVATPLTASKPWPAPTAELTPTKRSIPNVHPPRGRRTPRRPLSHDQKPLPVNLTPEIADLCCIHPAIRING